MTAEQQQRKSEPSADVAWRQSLGAGLLLGLALGCVWLVRWSPVWTVRLLMVVIALLLGVMGLSLMVTLSERRHWFTAVQRPLEVSFGSAGVPFFSVLAILALAAVTSGNNLLYLVVSGLLAALLVSGVASALNLSGMVLRFRLPGEIRAGQAAPIHFTLSNEKGFWPAYSVTVLAASRAATAPAVPGGEIAMRPMYFAYLPRRRSVSSTSTITFPRRGRFAPAAFTLATRFPFGLMLKRRRFQSEEREPELLVYPQPIHSDAVLPTGLRRGTAARRQQLGEGQDLYRIREHQPGDGARQVHWKASARARGLRVREFNQDSSPQVRLRLALPPELPPELAETAISLCAGWVDRLAGPEGEALKRQDGAAELLVEFAGENAAPGAGLPGGIWLPPAPAARQRSAILEYLALVDAAAPAGPVGPYDPECFEILIDGRGESPIPLSVSNRSADAV